MNSGAVSCCFPSFASSIVKGVQLEKDGIATQHNQKPYYSWAFLVVKTFQSQLKGAPSHTPHIIVGLSVTWLGHSLLLVLRFSFCSGRPTKWEAGGHGEGSPSAESIRYWLNLKPPNPYLPLPKTPLCVTDVTYFSTANHGPRWAPV